MENFSSNICPYLGMKEDQTTPVGYPSTRNVCYHSQKNEIPNLNYQRSTCLGGRFRRCPMFYSEALEWMPRSIRYRPRKSFGDSKKLIYIILALLLIVVIVFILVNHRQWTPIVSQLIIPSWQKTQRVRTYQPLPTFTNTVSLIEDPTETRETTLTPTLTITPELTETVTGTMTPVNLALDTPIGGDIQFIIHRVLAGESLFEYARVYDTNVDAISSVNYNLPPILFVDLIVIIPIGVDDPAGLPQFEAFQVTMRGLTVDSLAEELIVDPESLSRYNNLPMDYIFNPGDWILVPRE
jgi:hypothetical protein